MRAPVFIRRHRAATTPYREMRRKYRRDRRERAASHFKERARQTNLALGLGLPLGGALMYCGWGVVRDMEIDPIGLALAAVLPPLVYGGWTYLIGRRRAPVLAYGRYREDYERRNPPTPWATSWQAVPSDLGVKLDLRLILGTRVTAAAASEVRCSFYFREDSEAVSDRAITDVVLGQGVVSPILFTYPDDFVHPEWPLEPGRYQLTWHIRGHDGSLTHLGGAVRIRRSWRPR